MAGTLLGPGPKFGGCDNESMRLFALLAAVAASAATFAQAPSPSVEVQMSSMTVKANGTIKGKLVVTFEEGYHGYANPPKDPYQIPVSVSVGDKKFKLVKVQYPKGKAMKTQSGDSLVYEGKTIIPFEAKALGKPGNTTLKLLLKVQQCDATSCWAPETITINAPLTVKKS